MMNVMERHVETSAYSRTNTCSKYESSMRLPTLLDTKTQNSRMPLYFNCLGGNWKGQIELNAGSCELRIQGFPPVKAGQEIQFQQLGL